MKSLQAAASVRISNVTKSYAREGAAALLALDDVSLEIAPGEFCSIIGPSGCGKSTLLMMVAGLYDCSIGTIAVNDVPVKGPQVGAGMVFQRDVLLDWRSVLDNVLLPVEVLRLPMSEYREKALGLLELVGLREFAGSFPDELSGGMRQRVAICRALIHDPPLLLMDEPFGALDALTREKINLDLARLTAATGQTVVFVTHSIDEAVFMSDRIVVMSARPGKIFRNLQVGIARPRSLETRNSIEFAQGVAAVRAEFHTMGVI